LKIPDSLLRMCWEHRAFLSPVSLTGVAFRVSWREALMATFWFVMALIGVVRDLNQASR